VADYTIQHSMPRPRGQDLSKTVTMLLQNLYRAGLWSAIASLVVGCSNPPPPAPPDAAAKPDKASTATPPAAANTGISTRASYAATPRDYRRDGAAHLYARNSQRIFAGKLPPQLYAVGVLQVDINASGAVTAIRWMRAPRHAPEVVAEIERSVRAAAPFPAPIKLGKVTYTDTWLWHKSGQFQLDTLTEGQL
jgi:protein TonB